MRRPFFSFGRYRVNTFRATVDFKIKLCIVHFVPNGLMKLLIYRDCSRLVSASLRAISLYSSGSRYFIARSSSSSLDIIQAHTDGQGRKHIYRFGSDSEVASRASCSRACAYHASRSASLIRITRGIIGEARAESFRNLPRAERH